MKTEANILLSRCKMRFFFSVLFCMVFLINISAQPVYHWQNVAIGGGSYITGIRFHPNEKDLIYIETDIGGSYRWNEGELRWIPLTDHFTVEQRENYRNQSLTIDPGNPDRVYIVVREGKILKSSDRGDNWIEFKMDVPIGSSIWWCTDPLKVDPFDSESVLYISRNHELFKSNDGGVSWQSKRKFSESNYEFGVLGIIFDPLVRGKAYASCFEEGIFETTDGGESWVLLEGSPKGVLKMALSREGILHTAGRVQPKVAKMNTDRTWDDLTPQKYNLATARVPSSRRALEGFNFCGIDVNPFNSDHIVISLDYITPNKILQSYNGGESWIEVIPQLNHTIPWWPKSWWGGGVAELKFDPLVPNRVWFVDFKGVWRTEDITVEPSVWTNYLKGQEEIVITDLIAPPAAPSSGGYMLMSVAADVDGFVHYDLNVFPEKKLGPPRYQYSLSLDYCASNPSHVVRVGESYAINHIGNFIVPELDPNPFGGSISSDEGKTWKPFGSLPITKGNLTRVAMSATDPKVILMMTGQGPVYRTKDGGDSWQEVKTLPDEGFAAVGYADRRKWLVSDRVNGQKFYYYHYGKFYISTDAGITFLPTAASLPSIEGGGRGRQVIPTILAVSGMEGEVWAGLDDQGLYRSSNSGSSFSKIRNVDKVLLFAFGKPLEGTTNPVLYLYGTVQGKSGVFRSLDFGRNWQDISPKNVVGIGCYPLVMEASKQHAGLVFIGTFGRGIYYGVPESFYQ